MIAKPISRRELLKDTGALVVGFSILGQASRARLFGSYISRFLAGRDAGRQRDRFHG
jgi:hypothetical protein